MAKIKAEITKANVVRAVEAIADAESENDYIAAFAAFLDDITPAGPLEPFDGPAFEYALRAMAAATKRDPVKVAKRKAKRAARKAARKG